MAFRYGSGASAMVVAPGVEEGWAVTNGVADSDAGGSRLAVEVGVSVEVGVGLSVGDGVGVEVGVAVGEGVGVGVEVPVAEGEGVALGTVLTPSVPSRAPAITR